MVVGWQTVAETITATVVRFNAKFFETSNSPHHRPLDVSLLRLFVMFVDPRSLDFVLIAHRVVIRCHRALSSLISLCHCSVAADHVVFPCSAALS